MRGHAYTSPMAHENHNMPPAWLTAAREVFETDFIIIDGDRIESPDISEETENSARLTDGNQEWYVFTSAEAAGEAAREYWEHMSENSPQEFATLVGADTLICWAMGDWAGPGSTKTTSLSDWLDLWLDTPEEHFGSYNQKESNIEEIGTDLEEELGFKPTVAYRAS